MKSDGMQEALSMVVLRGEVAAGNTPESFFKKYLEETLREGMDGVILASALASLAYSSVAWLATEDAEEGVIECWRDLYGDLLAQAHTPVELASLEVIKDRFMHITGEIAIKEYLRHLKSAAEAYGAQGMVAAMATQIYGILQMLDVRGAISSQEALSRTGLAISRAIMEREGQKGDK